VGVLVDQFVFHFGQVGGTFADVVGALGHVAVIKQRRGSTKSFAAEQLFEDVFAVNLEALMALARYLPQLHVAAHKLRLAAGACRPYRVRSGPHCPPNVPVARLRWNP
jgi:hypothetical protein